MLKWLLLLVVIFVVQCHAIYSQFMGNLLYPGDYYLRLLLEEDDTDENNAEYSAIKKS